MAVCLEKLKGYALESENLDKEYKEFTRYSNEHLSARFAFFDHYIHKEIDKNYNSYTYYEDIKTKKYVGEKATNGGIVTIYNNMNIFVDRSYNISQGDKYNRKFNVFGYSNNDDINVNIEDNVYVEGGLGSDTITTGSGDDTIYTNANIADNFDDETSGTTNTVHAGAGDDNIHGSNGIDKIYGEDGDDILDGGKGIDHIFGGTGSDTLVLKGISKDEANFTQSGKDLIINFTYSNETITIKDHFKGLLKSNKIENIIFDKDENLKLSQIDNFITNKWNKITYNDISNKFNSNISESVVEFINLSNSNKFANSTNSPFITQNQIDKIIEQINTYSDDKGLGNFAFNDIQNSQNLQLYGV